MSGLLRVLLPDAVGAVLRRGAHGVLQLDVARNKKYRMDAEDNTGLSFKVDTDRNPKPNLLLPTSTSSLLTSKYNLSISMFSCFSKFQKIDFPNSTGNTISRRTH